MKNEFVNLIHGTDPDYLDEILLEGVKTEASRGEAPDGQENLVENSCVYLYDAESLPEWCKNNYNEVFVECSVPKQNLYVTKFGNSMVEKMGVDEYKRRGFEFGDMEEKMPYSDHTTLMYLHPGDIPPEGIAGAKW